MKQITTQKKNLLPILYKKSISLGVYIALCIGLCFGMYLMPTPQAFANEKELTICAATSLTDAFNELIQEFNKDNNLTIYTNYAASSALLKQIMGEVPADIFASADQKNMQIAVENNLVENDSLIDFAKNSVVLIIPKNSQFIPQTVQDLLKPEYKTLAIAQTDSVPIGRYAKAALVHENLWDSLQNRMVYASNVRAILAYVARGEAEAGFVYSTDAQTALDDVRIISTLQGHEPVLYPMAVLKNSSNKKHAQAFIDFAVSPQGKAILEKHGFGTL